ncbi:hypothetical protein OG819_57310 [Streptomyces sp. NBC_01549]|nr:MULTISPECIES: hypothetical protein [unclassified Streptomyces]MCX4598678.1 hypothetical protein [Streptomyces sp. NBC_01549]
MQDQRVAQQMGRQSAAVTVTYRTRTTGLALAGAGVLVAQKAGARVPDT